MIKMFAIKCSEGYLRIVNEDEVRCVELAKATVFGSEGLETATKAIGVAKRQRLTDLRIVELEIVEKDPGMDTV